MNANSNTKEKGRNFDIAKWILITVLIVIAIVGNYYFRQYNSTLRFISVVFILFLAGGIALYTSKGKATLEFSREALVEIRKVIWPTRQETLQTTLIITIVTIVMALILWGLDGVLVRLISFITSLRF
ncbi:Protein translocase subunit SecE [Candidatus Arsenophonus lipoptenae]|uniref:Protein translocase subunit SecE n=1 Tax=Candidatus Arsenophonus lipoptenae TaxID=634113 RepID=A0A0X9VE44_9GAMM|nr:preprotein translocase subunit SecE [Candidatus Arsenophonus lipoptenae]AMA64869.1 Protein translocase subunit SecE [Candidatus Arsenophonus lipoptenae]